jgi:hypothetical protein
MKSARDRRCRWSRLAFVAVAALCAAGCESISRDLADKGDPGHAGAHAHSLEQRDANGIPMPRRDDRFDR